MFSMGITWMNFTKNKKSINMDFINQLLAGFIQTFKQKNPKIFKIVASVLLIGFASIQVLIGQEVIEATAMTTQIIQYIDIVALALLGSKTAPYLREYFDGIAPESMVDEWFTKLLDGFKMKSPMAYGIIAVALLTSFTGIQYSLQFGIIPDGNVSLFLQIVSYLELGGLVLLGSRTGEYIKTLPPASDGPKIQTSEYIAAYRD